nr:MAG TPA: hypothetical protein [Caudoviricetes sp.]
MNMFEKLTRQNRITPPFSHKVRLNNTTFNVTDVEEIQFVISFEKVLVYINNDQIASFTFNENALQDFGVKGLIMPTSEELMNMPGTHSYSCGSFFDSNFFKNIIFFVTDNEGFDEKINLNVIFKNILYVLKKAYNRHQNY